mmetsp:Transcript_7905/g.25905  ORF Transcript_7905/g.25905 Transcript_7905/m.25905 type:complete len:362 (+) Transcript_7905:99-1184(+)
MSASKADDAALYPCRIDDPFLLSLHPTVRRALAWVFVTLLASLYYLLPATVLVSLALATCGHVTTAAAIGLVLLGGSLLPLHERPYTRRLCQVYYELFRLRHNLTQERIRRLVEDCVERGERYILGMHPHGVVPLQVLLWVAFADQYLRTAEHGTVYGFGGMASVICYLPGLRTLMGWWTGMPATYSNLKRNLTSGCGATFTRAKHPGRNLYMLPGGVAEIFAAQPARHVAVWKPRRGLCRLALETGARLTPMYVFGGNDFYFQSLTSDSWLARTSRSFGCSVTLFWGRWWWLPTVPLTPPHGCTIAIAEPLPSRRAAAADGRPSDDEVEALHAEYERALVEVFDQYKAAAGYPDAELTVL